MAEKVFLEHLVCIQFDRFVFNHKHIKTVALLTAYIMLSTSPVISENGACSPAFLSSV